MTRSTRHSLRIAVAALTFTCLWWLSDAGGHRCGDHYYPTTIAQQPLR